MFFYIIISFIGLGISLYAFFEISVWGGLYFDRDYLCIEKYRKPQKLCDAISVLHNIIVSYCGIVLLFAGVIMAFHISDVNFGIWFTVAFFLFVVDGLVLLWAKHSDIPKVGNAIKEQWDKQKRVSLENDHEVNMYRGAIRVCVKYGIHNIFHLTLLLITYIVYCFVF